MVEQTSVALSPISDYAIQKMSAAEIKNVINENLNGVQLSTFGLDRARVPSGGMTVWTVPSLEGEDTTKVIEGVIIYQRPNRSYWAIPFAEKDRNSPPSCHSDDLITGVGEPGGLCKDCPYNQFGSDPRGVGKSCRETRLLFVLRQGEILPLLVVAPVMSVKPIVEYMKRLTSKAQLYYSVITRFELEKVRSSGNIDYAKIKVSTAQRLNSEDTARMKAFAEAIRPYLMDVGLEQEDVIGESQS
jgi:hypothetical protein